MIDRVPVPTDNLYKFYALFSLATLIFSLWGLLYLQRSTNDLLFDAIPRIEALKSEPSRSAEQNASLVILQKKYEVAVSDRRVLNGVLYGLFAVSLAVAIYGFSAWHSKIQPQSDAMARIQLELAQLQVEKLKLENRQLSDARLQDNEKRSTLLDSTSITGSELLRSVLYRK